MSLYAITTIVVAIVCFIISSIIYYQDEYKKLNQSYAAFSFLLGIYTFMLFGFHQASDVDNANLWLRAIGVWGVVFASAIFFILVLTEQNKLLNNRLFQGGMFVSCLVVLILDVGFPELTNTVPEYKGHGFIVRSKSGWATTLETVWLVGLLLYSFFICFKYQKQLNDTKRKRLVKLALGGIIVPGVYLASILIYSSNHPDAYRYEALAVLGNVVITGIALYQFNIFNLSSEVASRDIIANMSNFMILIDPEKNIVETNPATLELLHYPNEKLIKQSICCCFESDSCLLLIDECSRKNTVSDKETYLITKNGTKIPVLVSISKIERKGKHVGYVIVGNNLTEQKEAKKQLDTYNRQLVESNAELSQFVHVVSHDLKEPMRMVSNYVSLLNSRYTDQLDSTAQEFMGYAVAGTHQMKDLIDGLLEYSKVDRNYTGTKVNLESIKLVVLNSLRYAIKEHQASVESATLPTIQGNKNQLTQLFQNLISNGMKYRADDRNPIVQIDVEEQTTEWLFSIKDNGIGIEEDSKDRVFEMFQRLHKRTDKYKGTGIGLAICKKIVDKHNGRIWIESEVGVGSTFYFTISKNLN